MIITRRIKAFFPATADNKQLVIVIHKAYRDIVIFWRTFSNPPNMFVETSAFRTSDYVFIDSPS